jgi:phytoene/squalene synthetase
LPVEVLASHNLKVSDLANTNLAKNTSWKAFISEYFEVVRTHQKSAKHLFGYLDPRSRVQPKIMSEAYSQIFHQIIRSSGDVFTTPLKLTLYGKISLWVKINYLKVKAKIAPNMS